MQLVFRRPSEVEGDSSLYYRYLHGISAAELSLSAWLVFVLKRAALPSLHINNTGRFTLTPTVTSGTFFMKFGHLSAFVEIRLFSIVCDRNL